MKPRTATCPHCQRVIHTYRDNYHNTKFRQHNVTAKGSTVPSQSRRCPGSAQAVPLPARSEP